MSIFSVYAPVKNENYNITPFTVHKEYFITTSSFDTRGYKVYQGRYKRAVTPVSSSKALNDPKNSDGTYMHIAYKSLEHMYYDTNRVNANPTEVSFYENVYRNLHLTSSAIYVPYYDYGEGIQRETLIISDNDQSIILKDDGFGNLYDLSISTSSFTPSQNVIIDLNFDNLIKNTKVGEGYIKSGSLIYKSTNHSPEDTISVINATLEPGIFIGTSSFGSSLLLSSSYLHLENNEYVSFDSDDDFSISFWIKTDVSSSVDYQYIVSKRGVLKSLKYGDYTEYNEKGELLNRRGLYPFTEDVQTNVYPFSIKYISSGSELGKISFQRSDGSTSVTMITSGSVNDNSYHHILFSKSGSNLYLYRDGNLESSGSDVPGQVFNYHDIVVGSLNRKRDYSFEGNLFDLKVYNTAMSSQQVDAIATTQSIAVRQSPNVGNVFYNSGVIAITSPHPKYHDIFNNNYTIYYKNTLTHYEIETVCVIDKDKFNYTLNPSSLDSFKQGRYMGAMISGSLKPYATTIGLYNASNELVAVGKLASPLKIRDDVDMNVIVRMDY